MATTLGFHAFTRLLKDPFQDMTLLHILRHPSRIHDVKFSKRVNGDEDILLIAAEDKKLSVYSIPANREETPTIIAEMTGHTNR